MAGKHFGDWDLLTQLDSGVLHSSQFALIDNGYFLLFTFTAQDGQALDEMLRTMDSLRFTDSSH